ncbi:MAG: right-handed parallel beta-helix repeat-containing protein [Sphingopyxis sp.]
MRICHRRPAPVSSLAASLLLLGACGGGGSSSPIVILPPGGGNPPPAASPCTLSVGAGSELQCQLAKSAPADAVALSGAPLGMVALPSGKIRWSPLSHQVGVYTITASVGGTSQQFTVTVTAGAAAAAGLYVAPGGDDGAAGTAAAPLRTLDRAARLATPGTTIFMRGGLYRNAEYGQPYGGRTSANFVRITSSGTASAPITIRPNGNEIVRIESDVNGIVFANANYWVVDGLELVGNAATLSYDSAMSAWWTENNHQFGGRGIVNNGAQHIVVRNNIVHDFPDAGISATDADWITVSGNIVYNNAWWTISGVNGVTNSRLLTTDPASANDEKMLIENNLVFANQSLIISHVFSKGSVSLVLDEGNGLHLQNNSATYSGRSRVEGNVMLFNGKGGLGLNTIDQVTVRNNVFYRNARVVDVAELVIQSSTLDGAAGNLFQPRTERATIKDFQRSFANIGSNATTGAARDGGDYPSVVRLSTVFRDPAALDFRPANGVPAGMGVPDATLNLLFGKAADYGIAIAEPTQIVDSAYLSAMITRIFATWPASHSTIQLEDRNRGYTYSYAQRCQWPNAPSASPC